MNTGWSMTIVLLEEVIQGDHDEAAADRLPQQGVGSGLHRLHRRVVVDEVRRDDEDVVEDQEDELDDDELEDDVTAKTDAELLALAEIDEDTEEGE